MVLQVPETCAHSRMLMWLAMLRHTSGGKDAAVMFCFVALRDDDGSSIAVVQKPAATSKLLPTRKSDSELAKVLRN